MNSTTVEVETQFNDGILKGLTSDDVDMVTVA